MISDVYYKEIGKDNKKRRYCKVKCLKCGNNNLEAAELSLKREKTGQCRTCRRIGNRENGNPNNKNSYEFFDKYVIGYTNNNNKFYFDTEDYDLLKKYCWHINQQGYVMTQIDKKKILMHRMIMSEYENLENSDVIDHLNRKRNYNLKSNLRIVTMLENNQNNNIYKNNTSGTTGVSFDKNSNKWISYINYNSKRIYAGSFDDIQEAVDARILLERQYLLYLTEIKEIITN